MMQVCRLVWNHAARPGYSKATGVANNPFAGMSIEASSGAGKGNRDATRAEYDLYRATARELGFQSMATAAAICFEGCQRVYDAFGFEDPDGDVVRGVFWHDYQPGVQIALTQSKTGKLIQLPLTVDVDGERVPLYPELEEELARTPRTGGEGEMIVRREGTGEPYNQSYMAYVHRKIRNKAGLPKDLRFTSFRHGGLTELGDAGNDDMRAVSGHSKVETTSIYNKANIAKARAIAVKRREHVKLITAGEKGGEQ
jgi:integrase